MRCGAVLVGDVRGPLREVNRLAAALDVQLARCLQLSPLLTALNDLEGQFSDEERVAAVRYLRAAAARIRTHVDDGTPGNSGG